MIRPEQKQTEKQVQTKNLLLNYKDNHYASLTKIKVTLSSWRTQRSFISLDHIVVNILDQYYIVWFELTSYQLEEQSCIHKQIKKIVYRDRLVACIIETGAVLFERKCLNVIIVFSLFFISIFIIFDTSHPTLVLLVFKIQFMNYNNVKATLISTSL